MKNNIWFIIACVLVFFVGYNMNDIAISYPKYKVAVIDVPQVLSNSKQVQEINRKQDKEIEELNILISKAQNELLNESDKMKLLQKENNYRTQIEAKKKDIDNEYSKGIAKVNEEIRVLVSRTAKKNNYNLVLPTGMVISGGEDITPEIIKNMK